MPSRRQYLQPIDVGGLLAAQPPGMMGQLQPYRPSLRGALGDVIHDLARRAGLPASRMRDEAMAAADFVPGVGEAVGVDDTQAAFNRGNYGEAAVNAAATGAGMVPVGGDAIGGLMKAIFAGVGAKTANHAALAKAKEMAAAGADRDTIWRETDWFQGPDGKWRFEIDDSGTKFTPKALDELMSGPGGAASGMREAIAPGVLMHKKLYEGYPNVRGTQVTAYYKDDGPIGGVYDGVKPRIIVSSDELGTGESASKDSLRGVLLHEMQHDVQANEGFARGGNPSDPSLMISMRDIQTTARDKYEELSAELREYQDFHAASDEGDPNTVYARLANEWKKINPDKARLMDQSANIAYGGALGPRAGYHNLAGEVEARNVQTRMNMTAQQRKTTPPWATQDVPYELQIVRGNR